MYNRGGGRSGRGRSSHQSYQGRGGRQGHQSHYHQGRGGRGGGGGYHHRNDGGDEQSYKLCKYFTAGQMCRNGDGCRFAHVIAKTAALHEGQAAISSITFSVTTGSIASASSDGMLRLWSCASFQRESAAQVGFSANYVLASQQLLLVCFDDGLHTGGPPVEGVAVGHAKAISLADNREFPLLKDAFMQHAHAQSVVSAAFMDQAGMQILTGGLEGLIHEWAFVEQTQTFQLVKTYEGHARGVTCLQYVPELNLLWSGSQDTTIRVWNTGTAECMGVITAAASSGHSDAVTCMERFDVDGATYIVTGGLDQQVIVYEASNGAHVSTTGVHVDGRIVIQGLPQLGNVLCILDQQSGSHAAPVRAIIACSQHEFASAGEDGVIMLWQLQQPLEVPAAPISGMPV